MDKKNVIISGLNLRDNNRGTAALGYGAISFLRQQKMLAKGDRLINLRIYKNFMKPSNWSKKQEYFKVDGIEWQRMTIGVFLLEWWILCKTGFCLPWSSCVKMLKQVRYVAAINGGDGFSDIYGTNTFHSRLIETLPAIRLHIPIIQLPQTFGPFSLTNNYKKAQYVLRQAQTVYVRDDKFVPELEQMGIKYKMSKDLSAFMQPQAWDIDIKTGCVGINVSGLAYSNGFRTLAGQFEAYPELINRLIGCFRDQGHTVYLIPHSYNYRCPEQNNDDMIACRLAYEKLQDKNNIVLVDKDLTSPQVKYVISKMSFFIGTRMHANFAAIYSGVPLFGLAYSYKFEGAFNANGLDGKRQTVMINNITLEDIDTILAKVEKTYQELVLK